MLTYKAVLNRDCTDVLCPGPKPTLSPAYTLPTA